MLLQDGHALVEASNPLVEPAPEERSEERVKRQEAFKESFCRMALLWLKQRIIWSNLPLRSDARSGSGAASIVSAQKNLLPDYG